MKCECCKTRKAEVKDYRKFDGGMNKVFVCSNCFMLADIDFYRFYTNEEKIKDYGNLI